jgi:hypothetical protein
VVAAAFALSTLSFAAGVAGDLSLAIAPTSGERVVLRLPPELPPDTVRAAPLPPLVSTPAAEARPIPVRSQSRTARVEPSAAAKPRRDQVHAEPKVDLDRAPKPDEAQIG